MRFAADSPTSGLPGFPPAVLQVVGRQDVVASAWRETAMVAFFLMRCP
jgi:hypothetical protein